MEYMTAIFEDYMGRGSSLCETSDEESEKSSSKEASEVGSSLSHGTNRWNRAKAKGSQDQMGSLEVKKAKEADLRMDREERARTFSETEEDLMILEECDREGSEESSEEDDIPSDFDGKRDREGEKDPFYDWFGKKDDLPSDFGRSPTVGSASEDDAESLDASENDQKEGGKPKEEEAEELPWYERKCKMTYLPNNKGKGKSKGETTPWCRRGDHCTRVNCWFRHSPGPEDRD